MRPVIGIAGIACGLIGIIGGAQAETVLTYSNWLPQTHLINEQAILPFIEEVQTASDGRIKIETLPKVVGSVPGQYDVAVDGLADITFIIMGYTPGRFPLSEVVELPFVGDDPEATSVAYYQVYRDDLEKYNEFKGVKLLSLCVASPSHIATSKKLVTEIDDLQGLKMRNPIASFIPAAEAMGTVPINKPISELYELASSGVVDGGFAPLDSMNSFNLKDVLPNMTLVEGGLFSPGLALVMNEETWNSLSPEDQEIVLNAAGEKMARAIGAGYAASDKKARVDMAAMEGRVVQEASPALMAALREKLSFVKDAWIEKATAAGVANAAEVANKLQKTVKSLQE